MKDTITVTATESGDDTVINILSCDEKGNELPHDRVLGILSGILLSALGFDLNDLPDEQAKVNEPR